MSPDRQFYKGCQNPDSERAQALSAWEQALLPKSKTDFLCRITTGDKGVLTAILKVSTTTLGDGGFVFYVHANQDYYWCQDLDDRSRVDLLHQAAQTNQQSLGLNALSCNKGSSGLQKLGLEHSQTRGQFKASFGSSCHLQHFSLDRHIPYFSLGPWRYDCSPWEEKTASALGIALLLEESFPGWRVQPLSPQEFLQTTVITTPDILAPPATAPGRFEKD